MIQLLLPCFPLRFRGDDSECELSRDEFFKRLRLRKDESMLWERYKKICMVLSDIFGSAENCITDHGYLLKQRTSKATLFKYDDASSVKSNLIMLRERLERLDRASRDFGVLDDASHERDSDAASRTGATRSLSVHAEDRVLAEVIVESIFNGCTDVLVGRSRVREPWAFAQLVACLAVTNAFPLAKATIDAFVRDSTGVAGDPLFACNWIDRDRFRRHVKTPALLRLHTERHGDVLEVTSKLANIVFRCDLALRLALSILINGGAVPSQVKNIYCDTIHLSFSFQHT